MANNIYRNEAAMKVLSEQFSKVLKEELDKRPLFIRAYIEGHRTPSTNTGKSLSLRSGKQ